MADDPAFANPVKPIGLVYGAREAREIGAIGLSMGAGVIVICAGGGGIPVVVEPGGGIRGAEAVIDKDLSAALLACELGADALLLLTDVSAVEVGWRTPAARKLRAASPEFLRAQSFEPGTMAPKAEAACRFAERTGGLAAIGALADAAAILGGEAGTAVRSGAPAECY